MYVAEVRDWAEAPRLVTVDRPTVEEGQRQFRVLATGAHQVVRTRAAGKHYSAKTLPHVPGVDAVVQDEATGKLYYVMGFGEKFGTFTEYITLSDRDMCIPVPDGVDPTSFAASVNPAMSSWMAITQRTRDLPAGWTALVIGATSASGQLAVHAAKSLGAARVIGVARSEAALRAQPALDGYVVQREVVEETDFSSVAADVDVILDYVYGDVALHLLSSLRTRKPVQYVQIGTLGGEPTLALPGPLLRSTDLTIRGAGPGSWSPAALGAELKTLVPIMAKWPTLETVKVPLSEIETKWNDKSAKGRVVFIP
ncbi:hypothetical protein BX600DRAFT_517436 [Xylariales sp. PMI_506]|nr:hypothetical protein BX600DRAFT_517436 [Xylariales sp. PMI_506]